MNSKIRKINKESAHPRDCSAILSRLRDVAQPAKRGGIETRAAVTYQRYDVGAFAHHRRLERRQHRRRTQSQRDARQLGAIHVGRRRHDHDVGDIPPREIPRGPAA
jgi:hypothetical protein